MIHLSDKKLVIALFCVFVSSIVCGAQTFTTLVVFDGTNGATPVDTPLVQGIDGNLYGTTLGGGANGLGTVFKMSPTGELTTIYSFCSQANCADGSLPYGGLVIASDGNFYGTTNQGGSTGIEGTVFKITPRGTLTTLHSFTGGDGFFPVSPLIQGRNGLLYGIAQDVVFSISISGKFTFVANVSGFLNAPLMQASDGNLYSTSEYGGTDGHGMIFKVTPTGEYSVVHSFNSSDGSAPAGGLLQGRDGNLYGTTYQGGSDLSCPNGCGTVFKLNLSGTLTTLHNFNGTDGSNPIAALIQANDGNFYGTTYGGGSHTWGTVFAMKPTGRVRVLHSFTGSDGGQPYGPVSQDTNGSFYGTATNGTTSAQGTAFMVSTGLTPFVSFLRAGGKVGQTVEILGQGLRNTSAVSFGNVAATFQTRSDTYLTVVVPEGATTGFVEVTTANGVLKSNVAFRVVQ